VNAGEPYNLLDVPDSPDAGSRFALGKSRGGHNIGTPGEVAVQNYGALVAGVLEPGGTPYAIPAVTLSLRGWVVDAAGVYHEVPRGSISGDQVLTSRRPGKLGKCKLVGPKLLDSFFLGDPEGAFGTATDAEVWKAGLAFCEAHESTGRALRELSDYISVALALRLGFRADVASLPNLGEE